MKDYPKIILRTTRNEELYNALVEAAKKDMKSIQEWIWDACREKLKKIE